MSGTRIQERKMNPHSWDQIHFAVVKSGSRAPQGAPTGSGESFFGRAVQAKEKIERGLPLGVQGTSSGCTTVNVKALPVQGIKLLQRATPSFHDQTRPAAMKSLFPIVKVGNHG